MNFFGNPPEDLDYSNPVEPMRLIKIGDQGDALKEFLSELVDSHKTKLKTKEKHRLRDTCCCVSDGRATTSPQGCWLDAAHGRDGSRSRRPMSSRNGWPWGVCNADLTYD